AVALSANGNVLVEGGYGDNYNGSNSVGATWAFRRTAGIWAPFGGKLIVPGETVQGFTVGLSADGRTAIGGGQDNSTGPAWILNRAQPRAPGDFDGDGQADAMLFRSNGDWAALTSSSGFTAQSSVNWSFPGYVPVRGDFDRDGVQDPALYNPITGNWRML